MQPFTVVVAGGSRERVWVAQYSVGRLQHLQWDRRGPPPHSNPFRRTCRHVHPCRPQLLLSAGRVVAACRHGAVGSKACAAAELEDEFGQGSLEGEVSMESVCQF